MVLDVAGNLNFNGFGINVNGLGFRDGAGRTLTTGAAAASTDYYSLFNTINQAQKAEGSAGTPAHVLANGATTITNTGAEGYPSGSIGRGAPGNAAGGANDNLANNSENSGGGGGANGGAGGRRGNTWNTNQPIGGVGGAAFTSTITNLIMGGGGGAGTTNNSSGTRPGTVDKFITTPGLGTLYLGTTALAVNSQVLLGDVSNLKFDPATGSSGTFTFTYTAVDNQGAEDLTPATYNIPIVADNAAVYSTPNTFNKDALVNTLVLATVSDADGALTSATLAAGSTLPPGTSLNAVTGAITVSNVAALVSGTYNFTVNTVDNKGGQTAAPVSITIYNDTEAVYSSTAANTFNKDALALNSPLATVSDFDGVITSAIVSGTALPTWMSLNAITGTITVNNAAAITAGTYSTSVNTVDNKGGKSTVPVTIVINNDVEAVYFVSSSYSRFALTNGTPVATVTDADGALVGATRTGTALPNFLTLNANGTLTVNSNSVVDGTHITTVNTTDAKGGTSTNIPVSITINSDLYQPNNDAVKLADNCYQLTPDQGTKRGEVWRVTPINFANSFEVSFNAYLGNKDGGADGIAFGFQRAANPLFASGQTGEGLGFGDRAARTGGIKPSVTVEFDTYQNNFTGSGTIEPAFDNISIFKNGDERNPVTTLEGSRAVQMSSTNANVEDNVSHPVRIIWKKSTNTLYGYFNNVLRASYSEDFVTTVFGGDPTVYFGFTASTTNRHEVCEITFTIMDEDGDGIADAEDLDDDNDGIPDKLESGGFDPSADDDNDGIVNYKDASFPNGNYNYNSTTLVNRLFDKDGDGIINAFDLDSDGDSITDAVEQTPNGQVPGANYSSNTGRLTSPVNTSGARIGIPSTSIFNAGTNLNDFDKDGLYNFLDIDADNDGINIQEAQPIPGSAVRTPLNVDTDKDGIDDRFDESCSCTTFGIALAPINTDGDAFADYLDLNSDNDLYGDAIKAYDSSDPAKVVGYSLNELKDLATQFASRANAAGNNAAAAYYTAQDLNNNKIPDWLDNTDSDGFLNYLDFGNSFYCDTDNDGWVDLFDPTNSGAEPTPNYLYRSNQTPIALPVELLTFAAKYHKQQVELTWSTASEKNSHYFVVECSLDGKIFSPIGQVSAAGTSNQVRKYGFTDEAPITGVSYYRLKQVDFNLTHQFSKVIWVNSKMDSSPSVKLYPNPAQEKATVEFSASTAETGTLVILNVRGQQVKTQKVDIRSGLNSIVLQVQDLASGKYIIRIKGLNIYYTVALIKN